MNNRFVSIHSKQNCGYPFKEFIENLYYQDSTKREESSRASNQVILNSIYGNGSASINRMGICSCQSLHHQLLALLVPRCTNLCVNGLETMLWPLLRIL